MKKECKTITTTTLSQLKNLLFYLAPSLSFVSVLHFSQSLFCLLLFSMDSAQRSFCIKLKTSTVKSTRLNAFEDFSFEDFIWDIHKVMEFNINMECWGK